METKQLTLEISVKTGISDDELIEAIKTNPRGFFGMLLGTGYPITLGSSKVIHFDRIVEFDIIKPKVEGSIWDEEISSGEEDKEDYDKIASDLYSFLLRNSNELRDNEYTFIRDMYSRSEQDSLDRITEKQANWLKALRSKYL